jgi:transposase
MMIKARDQLYRFNRHRELVSDAHKLGIKQTARRWRCSRNSVRLWLRRFKSEHLQGLKERSHAPRSCPHKTPAEIENRLLQL